MLAIDYSTGLWPGRFAALYRRVTTGRGTFGRLLDSAMAFQESRLVAEKFGDLL